MRHTCAETSSGDIWEEGFAFSDLTVELSIWNQARTRSDLLRAPMIDLSMPPPTLSSLALSKISFAMLPTTLERLLSVVLRRPGRLRTGGKIWPMRNVAIMKNVGLAISNAWKAATTAVDFPFSDPKSCENPAIPMLSRLKERIDQDVVLSQRI